MTPSDRDVSAFIDDLNDLQERHGLTVYCEPSGLAVYESGDTDPIGYLIMESPAGAGGPFETELSR